MLFPEPCRASRAAPPSTWGPQTGPSEAPILWLAPSWHPFRALGHVGLRSTGRDTRGAHSVLSSTETTRTDPALSIVPRVRPCVAPVKERFTSLVTGFL
jgi:hypothetical protein